MTPEDFMKLVSTYGLPTALAVFMVWQNVTAKKEPTGSGQVMGELKDINRNVQDLRERVSRIEGKLDA